MSTTARTGESRRGQRSHRTEGALVIAALLIALSVIGLVLNGLFRARDDGQAQGAAESVAMSQIAYYALTPAGQDPRYGTAKELAAAGLFDTSTFSGQVHIDVQSEPGRTDGDQFTVQVRSKTGQWFQATKDQRVEPIDPPVHAEQ